MRISPSEIALSIACCAIFLFGCNSNSDEDIQYVAMGASDVTGVGASPLTNGYVYKIEEYLDLNCNDTGLINLGIPGAEADEIADFELPIAEEIDPDLITIWTGANDIVSGRSPIEFQNNLIEILETLSTKTKAQVYIGNIPDLTKLPKFIEDPDSDVTVERIEKFNQIITKQANIYGAYVVNLSGINLSSFLVSSDGFHPNDEGHATIAQSFLDALVLNICNNDSMAKLLL